MLVNRSVPIIATVALAGLLGWLAANGTAEVQGRGPNDDPPAADDNRRSLPISDPSFKGVANRTLAGSKPDFPRPAEAPRGAPNVLLVLVDDAGFGNPSTFGGPCQTPTLTRLAERGLR